ncbi:MAG: TRAP transporter large permease subunit [Ignavibacteria bacterium]|nr:TRAP transporter large permease subunit [Bacteroidota bacterium]MSQ45886.1 TRAP transporter large permease subunit [Ignavibacteria bacterium]
MTILVILLIVLLLLIGAPLFTIIGSFSILGFSNLEIPFAVIIVELYRLASQPVLLAIPLFTFSGYLLAESKAPNRLVALTKSLIGWLPGGLAIVVLMTCAVFTALTGGSGITIVALGGLLYPILLSEKYQEKFALGLITTSGSLGLLFPPSLPLILYGIVSEVSIDKLFIAGLLPGTLLIVALSIYSIRQGLSEHVEKKPFKFSELIKSSKAAKWELPLPIIVIGGIYNGWFTATEAAAISAFYVFIVEVWIYKDLSLTKDIPKIMVESVVLVGAIIMILASAMGLTSYLIDQEVPQKLFELVSTFISNKYLFLIILNIFLLIVGMMMDIFSAIIVVVPLIIPVAKLYGIDPIHLGIIFLTNLEIGYLTPPVGLNLFISSFRFKKSIVDITIATLPFIITLLISLMIITYVPELSLWLVHLIKGNP